MQREWLRARRRLGDRPQFVAKGRQFAQAGFHIGQARGGKGAPFLVPSGSTLARCTERTWASARGGYKRYPFGVRGGAASKPIRS
jgi:hypothetical protein